MAACAVLALLLAFATATAAAAPDLKREEMLLAREAKQVDVFAAGADGARVSARIASEFGRVTVRRSAGDGGHRLTNADVRALRAKSLGYGEVAIVLALYANQPGSGFRSLDQILALRHESRGWGQVARTMGYEDLGNVIRDVKRAGAATQRAARGDARTQNVEPGPVVVTSPSPLSRSDAP
ncbi:MAG TPA: hypothetical protein VGL09_21750 [Methylomirabilota bacterium]